MDQQARLGNTCILVLKMKTQLEKAREIAERLSKAPPSRPITDWADIEFPDISCKKCGREIYCGVNTLCADPECEKKK